MAPMKDSSSQPSSLYNEFVGVYINYAISVRSPGGDVPPCQNTYHGGLIGGSVKVRVETYGCTMNQGEGRLLEEKLAALGHQIIDDASDADLVVLNTCTVIKETERRMLKRMAELSAQHKGLVVTGCMASIQADEIIKAAPKAFIMAPRDYQRFPVLVEEQFGCGAGAVALPSPITFVLPIAQGCIGNCTYCITKLARGTLSSYPKADVLDQAKKGLKGGARELLVTAQDTACYGFDLGTDLPDLLSSLTDLPGEFMVRVGMMNPDNLSRIVDRFLPTWTSPKVYHFLHLPVQSGSPVMLEAMNRGYRPQDFVSLAERLRRASPHMTLATDVIVGFPGETDEDHRSTVEMLRAVRPDIVNVTRFSPRQGTPAARARNQISGWVAKERSREMTKLRFEISLEINRAMVGRRERITITEEGKSGTSIGRTSSYKPVVVKGLHPAGSTMEVEIKKSAATHLFGEPR